MILEESLGLPHVAWGELPVIAPERSEVNDGISYDSPREVDVRVNVAQR